MTKILSFDPAIDLTGWALLTDDGSPDGALEDYGLIRGAVADNLTDRASSLFKEARALMVKHRPDIIAVEMPADKTVAWGKFAKRAALSGPVYGVAVGVVLAAALMHNTSASCLVRGIPVGEWAARFPKGDEQKTSRVWSAARLYGMKPEQFGAKSVAGNVADAVLLARYALLKQRWAAMDKTGVIA